jgi:2-polyprenyl-3-methyl-5-hydroxy-6-metoxy-1,4-benzoquinol methylase
LNEVTRALYSSETGFDSTEHNFAGLWDWEEQAVRMHFSGCRTVLVAGAGGGREAIALARLGLTVTAFDFCDRLTAACREHLKTAGVCAQVLDAPPNSPPRGLGTYDGIFAGRGFYHHIPGRARRIGFLAECRQHVVPGGPLFLSDFYTRPENSRPHRIIQLVGNAFRRLRMTKETVELGDWLSSCWQHAFLEHEIEAELRESGFQLKSYAPSPINQASRLAHAFAIAKLS